MQIIFDNTNNGELKVQIDCLDDLWVLYNILQPGDQIKGRTFRRVVVREGEAGTRKPMVILLHIKKVEFHEFSNRLRVLGTIMDGPDDWISIGDHHTFNLESGSRITIFKEKWYKNDRERIRKNLNKRDAAMILCVAIDSGMANLALLSNYSLTPIAEIRENIPGKRYAKQQYDKILDKFYKSVAKVINENVSRYNIHFIILCGPGFVKEHFGTNYSSEFGSDPSSFQIRKLNASSGELSAIYEVLRNGSVAEHVADLAVVHEEMLTTKFIENLSKDNGTVVYGSEDTYTASQMGAIEQLLVCDVVIRSSDTDLRQKTEDTLNFTEQARGHVHILSTKNPAGEQLESYGYIAGILRYRVDL